VAESYDVCMNHVKNFLQSVLCMQHMCGFPWDFYQCWSDA